MTLTWVGEPQPATWDADKKRIVGEAEVGVFDARYAKAPIGASVPGEWWRVERNGRTVGFGWMDVVWGDAEILLAVDPAAQGTGVGAFILEHLANEARAHGVNAMYNIVRPTHPDRLRVTAWLARRGFRVSEDGNLLQALVHR